MKDKKKDAMVDGNFKSREEMHLRRPWHKPPVRRIEIKRTFFGAASGNDGDSAFTTH
jgi:hypothetical protein